MQFALDGCRRPDSSTMDSHPKTLNGCHIGPRIRQTLKPTAFAARNLAFHEILTQIRTEELPRAERSTLLQLQPRHAAAGRLRARRIGRAEAARCRVMVLTAVGTIAGGEGAGAVLLLSSLLGVAANPVVCVAAGGVAALATVGACAAVMANR